MAQSSLAYLLVAYSYKDPIGSKIYQNSLKVKFK